MLLEGRNVKLDLLYHRDIYWRRCAGAVDLSHDVELLGEVCTADMSYEG